MSQADRATAEDPHLILVDRRFLDRVWPVASALLEPAMAQAHGEMTMDQLEMLVRRGESHLLLWRNGDEISGAATVDFHNFPSLRVAHVSFMGGRGIVSRKNFEELRAWCAEMGASEIRAWCGATQAKLFESVGFTDIYRIVRIPLC